MNAIRLVRVASGAGICVLVGLIVASSLEMSLLSGLKATVDTRWGVTTMVDLYLGLLAVAVWIAWREGGVVKPLAWLAGLCLLGNLTLLVYIFIASLRARSVDDLFRPAPR